jgi:spermidine/putrescine transport system substrate-binding protein
MSKRDKTKNTNKAKVTRRTVLTGAAAATAAGFTMKSTGPFIRNAEAATMKLRALIWEPYNVKSTVAKFEEETGAIWAPTFFDGNSEAFNKMKAGGTEDFDLVMSDGHWPRTYYAQDLVQHVDYGMIPNLESGGVDPNFLAPIFNLNQAPDDPNVNVACPNCWGGYGITVNTSKVDPEDSDTLTMLYNEKYSGHLLTSARFEENIALTGILAAEQMGTKNDPRPDGKSFDPYTLTDAELDEVKRLLIVQKPLLLTRYVDYDIVDRLMISGQVWATPEWALTYRRLLTMYRAGELDWQAKHVLRPKEGGLGWVDNWSISAGVQDSEKYELCHNWINRFLTKDNMEIVAREEGLAPVVDVRDRMSQEEQDDLLMDQTDALQGLYMFNAPSSPEKWEKVWAEVEAA